MERYSAGSSPGMAGSRSLLVLSFRSTALTSPAARWRRWLLTISTAWLTAALSGTRSMKRIWQAPSRSTSRTKGSSFSTGWAQYCPR